MYDACNTRENYNGCWRKYFEQEWENLRFRGTGQVRLLLFSGSTAIGKVVEA